MAGEALALSEHRGEKSVTALATAFLDAFTARRSSAVERDSEPPEAIIQFTSRLLRRLANLSPSTLTDTEHKDEGL